MGLLSYIRALFCVYVQMDRFLWMYSYIRDFFCVDVRADGSVPVGEPKSRTATITTTLPWCMRASHFFFDRLLEISVALSTLTKRVYVLRIQAVLYTRRHAAHLPCPSSSFIRERYIRWFTKFSRRQNHDTSKTQKSYKRRWMRL